MDDHPLADFLLPEGFRAPSLAAMLREGSVVGEAGRLAVRRVAAPVTGRVTGSRRAYVGGAPMRAATPVLLIPGFLAGDGTLSVMARSLRARGFRTYRSQIHANVGCTLEAATRIESRLEAITERRGARVQIVGHSLGGMIARGIAVRRPDLVAGVVTLGSPMLAPAAHHRALSVGVETLTRLRRLGVVWAMSTDCVAGECARTSFEESRLPVPTGVAMTCVYSRRDGVVDWRACIDAQADAVEVRASHIGMAIDPRVIDVVTQALVRQAGATTPTDRWLRCREERAASKPSVLEVDGGVGA